MKTRYGAFDSAITSPEVSYVLATSGMALSTAVLEMGDSRPHHEMTMTMTALRWPEKRLYTS